MSYWKKHPIVSQVKKPDKVCTVCGAEALGFNFGGLCCESCKSFFRRNVFNYINLTCRRLANKEGACVIEETTRRHCGLCRMTKCLANGMKPNLVNSFATNSESVQKSVHDHLFQMASCSIVRKELNNEERMRLEEVKHAMAIFVDENSLPLKGEEKVISEAFNMQAVYVYKVGEFVRRFYPFMKLTHENQLAILKPFVFELMAIRFAFNFNAAQDGFRICSSPKYDQSVFFKLSTCNELKEDSASILRKFHYSNQLEMESDTTIRNLMVMSCLYKSRNAIESVPDFFRFECIKYNHLLARYLECKYQSAERAEKKMVRLLTSLENVESARAIIQSMFNALDANIFLDIVKECNNIQ